MVIVIFIGLLQGFGKIQLIVLSEQNAKIINNVVLYNQ